MDSVVFNMAQMHRHGSAFYDYLQLRKRFFVDQLGWDIPHDDDVEMDQYDNPSAWYALVLKGGAVVGGARAMATTARWGSHTYMLRDVAEGRLGTIPAEITCGAAATPEVWESTRIVISDDLATAAERSLCLSLIMQGVAEVAARHGARELIGLSRVTLVRALRALGFPAERKGQPYTCADDGRQYAVLSMPLRPAHSDLPRHAPARVPAEMPTGIRVPAAMGSPAATHLSQPVPLHAPPVA